MSSRKKGSVKYGRVFLLLALLIILAGTGLLATKLFNTREPEKVIRDVKVVEQSETKEPEDYASMDKTALIDIKKYIPSLVIEMRYASDNNVVGQKIYNDPTPYLRKGSADKLKAVQEELAQKGYGLKIWDAYRPPRAQFKLWEACYDPRFVLNPYKQYSNHSRGAAVDVTLVDSAGAELLMPSGFDDFTALADRDYSDVSPTAAANAIMLQNVMLKHGFNSINSEWWHFNDSEIKSYDVIKKPPPASNGLREITISAIGDCTLTTDPRFPFSGSFDEAFQAAGKDYAYFFSNVKTVLENDDLTIANLETALTRATEPADKSHQSDAYFFKVDPSYTQILKEGSIEAVNIANNHSWDYLQQGFDDTIHSLKQAGILYFGYQDRACTNINDIKIGMLGYNVLGPLEEGLNQAELKEQILNDMKQAEKDCDLIIVSFHGGIEWSSELSPEQKLLARFAIDNGADLVLGHHPHVLQKVERYKNRYIAYSLGNFCFGNSTNPRDKDTMIFQQTFVFNDKNCCIDYSQAKVIPCSMSSVDYCNDFRPTVVEGQAAQSIHERVGM